MRTPYSYKGSCVKALFLKYNCSCTYIVCQIKRFIFNWSSRYRRPDQRIVMKYNCIQRPDFYEVILALNSFVLK